MNLVEARDHVSFMVRSKGGQPYVKGGADEGLLSGHIGMAGEETRTNMETKS